MDHPAPRPPPCSWEAPWACHAAEFPHLGWCGGHSHRQAFVLPLMAGSGGTGLTPTTTDLTPVAVLVHILAPRSDFVDRQVLSLAGAIAQAFLKI